ncbi:hypothetical protein H5410_062738 [Solanum commersonii]|uniref:Uncharacterized protein n=1 Tax=Solanum commersonii TaxID=4109 RepID=A0A9J5WCE4_SOLCO|nr:hypothetical protein H5410_062738 [Solanum commersonii]
MYCDKLIRVGRDDRILMKLFMRSLTEEALSRDYAIRWRSEAAKARPPMEESQMKDYFIRAQEPQYYDKIMLVVEKSFAEIIKLGERIEESIKSGTIINLEALQATNKAL